MRFKNPALIKRSTIQPQNIYQSLEEERQVLKTTIERR